MYRTTGYDRALNQIRGLTIELGRSVVEQIEKAIKTFDHAAPHIEWRCIDGLIDAQRDDVLKRCYNIMSLQQLRDQELRWILGYQRIAQEFERIGDYACDIAEINALNATGEWPQTLRDMANHLVHMCKSVVKLLDEAIVSELSLAEEDDLIDSGYLSLQRGMEAEADKQRDLVWGLILVQARTLERMGDHVVNIEEALEFIETGKGVY